ncbi:hypothetical protein VTK26DRAFT_1162 [Humicola hyalothermophila]
MVDHGGQANDDGLGKIQDFVEESGGTLVVVFCPASIELGDVRGGLSSHRLGFWNPLDAASVAKDVGTAAGQMLYELVGRFGELANKEKFAGGDVQEASLDLAPHETIFKVVIDDVPRGRLHGDDADRDLFVRPGTLGGRFGQAEQVAACRAANALSGLVKLAGLVDVGAFGVHTCEFSDEWGVAVVAGFLERCGFDLADDANFVASGNEAFDVNV